MSTQANIKQELFELVVEAKHACNLWPDHQKMSPKASLETPTSPGLCPPGLCQKDYSTRWRESDYESSDYESSHGCLRASCAAARFLGSNSNMGVRKSANVEASSGSHSYFSVSTWYNPQGFSLVILWSSPGNDKVRFELISLGTYVRSVPFNFTTRATGDFHKIEHSFQQSQAQNMTQWMKRH